jgi:hypothetical protein
MKGSGYRADTSGSRFARRYVQQLVNLAEKENRSLTQTTIVLLKEGFERRIAGADRRCDLLRNFSGIGIDTAALSYAKILLREDGDLR